MLSSVGVFEMKTYSSSRNLATLLLLLFALLLSGCGPAPEKTRKPSVDWSRGFPLGKDVLGTVGMAIDQDSEDVYAVFPFWSYSKNVESHFVNSDSSGKGKTAVVQNIHTIWPFSPDSGGFGLRYVQIDQDAQIKFDREVIQMPGQIRTPRLLTADDQHLHLFWTNRVEKSKEWQLFYALLDRQGIIQGHELQLSTEVSGVSEYDVASDLNGGVVVVWEDEGSGDMFFTRLSSSGGKQVEPVKVVSQGMMPGVQVDPKGDVHLVWFEENGDVMYQSLTPLPAEPEEGMIIAHIPLGTGPRLYGPAIGITDQWVYVFWSILRQSGLEAGTAKTQYVTFPAGTPKKVSNIFDIGVLPFEEQPYQPVEGGVTYTQLVPAAYATRSSDYLYDPVVTHGKNNELAVALTFYQEYRLDGHIQIVVVIMADGEYKGYTVASKTQALSSDAVLSSDAQGNLHLIWRDGSAGEKIYYTTTAPDARPKLDRLNLHDIKTVILVGGMESVSGILLFPLTLPWMFPGLILLVGWRLKRNDEDMTNKTSLILLVIAILSYQILKILIFPTMVDYVPFSAWVDVPGGWQLALRIGIPMIILGIAIGIAEWLRRRSTPSTLRYYLVVVISDTILTLAVYGVNFMGAY